MESLSNSVVFPNPTTNNINIEFEAKKEAILNINILDITGKIVFSNTFQSNLGSNNVELKIETLEAGLYFIEMSDSNSAKRIKIVKL